MTLIGTAAVNALLTVLVTGLTWAQVLRVEDRQGAVPTCAYASLAGPLRILKSGQSFKETRPAIDVTGQQRDIAVIATCREVKQGVAIDLATTLGDQPVAVYVVKSTKAPPVALRAGESVRDALYVNTANKEAINLPVTITCRNRGGVLDLEMTATLDGQPVEFYADSENTP